jgi:hypothetical protein
LPIAVTQSNSAGEDVIRLSAVDQPEAHNAERDATDVHRRHAFLEKGDADAEQDQRSGRLRDQLCEADVEACAIERG